MCGCVYMISDAWKGRAIAHNLDKYKQTNTQANKHTHTHTYTNVGSAGALNRISTGCGV